MSDENQIVIPPSYTALCVPAGRSRPSAGQAQMSARYEFCEDLANLLTEHARPTRRELAISEGDALERVLRRLVELLDWAALERPDLSADQSADQSAD